MNDLEKNPNTKTVHEFHPQQSASIKALGVKRSNIVAPSTCYSTGKMLTFAKLSLKSFIYDFCETFMFTNKKTKAIYNMYGIYFVYVYQMLTDTDSTSLQFAFFSKEENRVPEEMFRIIFFLVTINNKILERFDVSHEFSNQFNVQNVKTHKQFGLYEIEHIDDPCVVTIASNPKEYIELFESDEISKRHEGISKNEKSMDLTSFGKRINSVLDICEKEKDVVKQSRFSIKKK